MISLNKHIYTNLYILFIILIPFQIYFNFWKNLTISVASIVSAILFTIWIIHWKDELRKFVDYTVPTDLPIALFILVLITGTLYSPNKLHSIKYFLKWSSVILIYYFTASSFYFNSFKKLHHIILISSICSTLLSFLSFIQVKWGYDKVYHLLINNISFFSIFFEPETLKLKLITESMNWKIWQPYSSGLRAFGLFNCSITYSTYLGYHFFLVVSLLLSNILKKGKKSFTILLFLLLTINLITIFLTYTRSALISLLLSSIVLYILVISPHITSKLKWLILCAITISIIIIFPQIEISQSIKTNFRLFSPTITEDFKLQRFKIWATAIETIKSKPILGVGTASYPFAFPTHKEDNNTILLLPPHNQYLAIWAENGLIGLLIYLWMIYTLFKTSFVIFKLTTNKDIKILTSALISIWVWYCSQTIFIDLFYAEKISMLFWTLVGINGALYRQIIYYPKSYFLKNNQSN